MADDYKLNKTIKVSPNTHQRLQQIGSKYERFDDIIVRLLDGYSKS